MKNISLVSPSNQVNSTLPNFVSETYKEFVKFMTISDQSEERIGFSQDLLQNLQRYRDFNTYKERITQFGVLAESISAVSNELTLEDGKGFLQPRLVLWRPHLGFCPAAAA